MTKAAQHNASLASFDHTPHNGSRREANDPRTQGIVAA